MKRNIVLGIIIVVAVALIVGVSQFFHSKFYTQTIPEHFARAKAEKLAWSAFQNYLQLAKKHDIAGVKSLSFALSSVCQNVLNAENATTSAATTTATATSTVNTVDTDRDTCFSRMDAVYKVGSALKESDFSSDVKYDQKQIILSTKPKLVDDQNQRGYSRSVIFFTRDDKANPRLLNITPSLLVYLDKTKHASSTAELDLKLKEMMVDTDGDTITDEEEKCTVTDHPMAFCFTTDPTKRDTDGNGWWDSIDSILIR